MNFYIADCHFGHANILNLDPRPFADIRQMEESMVMLWNAAVGKGDTVYILGDFCWGKVDEWIRILNRLNGQKVLIRGNHDPEKFPADLRGKFADIKDRGKIRDGKRHVILSHFPDMFYEHSYDPNYYMLCGHVHNTAEDRWLEKWTAELREARRDGNTAPHANNCGQIINVGAMKPWMEYTPRTLDELIYRTAGNKP